MNKPKSNLIKLSSLLTALLILFLPFQFGKHFWPSFSYLSGIRVDYLSPVLYLNDIITLLLFTVFFISVISNRNYAAISLIKIKYSKIYYFFFVLFVAFVAMNVIYATKPQISTIYWIRALQFYLLWFMLKSKKIHLEKIINKILPYPMIFSSVLAVLQFIKQQSLNGIFYFAGERRVTLSTPGISKIIINNSELLRPYATFSHPNSLAGFLLITSLLLLAGKNHQRFKKLALVCSAVAILTSFSQTIWLLLAGALIYHAIHMLRLHWRDSLNELKQKKKQLHKLVIAQRILIGKWMLTSILIGSLIVTATFLVVSPEESTSISERITQIQHAFQLLKRSPVIGVGLGNYLPTLYSWSKDNHSLPLKDFQPVHNIFLLEWVEIGSVGIIIIGIGIIKSLKKSLQRKQSMHVLALVGILLSGLVDHYWITLYQNQLLLVVVLSLIWRETIGYSQTKIKLARNHNIAHSVKYLK